ncbi:ABC transporter ATP-binding protein [Azonexus sp.]|jgi:lipopolysaccharide transport system ATP-binding protein|uniref:ABC transporter ATP-binding protein n=1 Tax=Azonexus sp. TaxID=1872668 RepID=UPI00283A7840|nr:ABC transporter ATP-binding protein [Azonexus sp.]MDR1995926.1 ABC transporter ATP-binding protein [Azonexus sp.]
MSDIAIRIEGVAKSFRRFRHPGWRALDAFGIHVPRSRFDVFDALKGVDIEVRQGERVALIGRNGAGKSTLLRLISGQMQPDSGHVFVAGNIQALMELGTGFHPDFTGIENIRAALALQGVRGTSLRTQIDEIIDFTELEGFIERPVREYSAGMYARLAFAVATTIKPEILIVDEILGAGDAYFVGKSIQRMKGLTENGATVLFVSHDMSSVQLLCERAVWIDRGTVRKEGPILPVSKAYLAAVREDEEIRTRARSMSLTRQQAAGLDRQSRVTLFRLVGAEGKPPRKPLAVSAIRFGSGESEFGCIEPNRPDDEGSGPMLDATHMNWRGPETVLGRSCWTFGNFGGLYGHAPWQITWPSRQSTWIKLDVRRSPTDLIAIEQFDPETNNYVRLAEIEPGASDQWESINAACLEQPLEKIERVAEKLDLLELASEDRYGSGEAGITAFGFFDADGKRRHTLITGENASAVIACNSQSEIVDPVAVVAIYRPDGTCAMQVVSNRDGTAFGKMSGKALVKVMFSPLQLGPGDYIVSIALFKELNIATRVEPKAYDLHDRCYALKILPPPGVGVEIGVVNQTATWELTL